MNDPNYIPYKKSVGEAERGDSAYHHLEMAKPTALDAKDPVAGGCAYIGGDYVATPMKSASVTGPTGLVETTASNENLSAKYKYPQKSQDTVPQDLTAKPGSSI